MPSGISPIALFIASVMVSRFFVSRVKNSLSKLSSRVLPKVFSSEAFSVFSFERERSAKTLPALYVCTQEDTVGVAVMGADDTLSLVAENISAIV